MRALIQPICEYALYGTEGRDVPHFSHERMNKYVPLISEFGESRDQRELYCLFGIQQFIHRLEHPQGKNSTHEKTVLLFYEHCLIINLCLFQG